VEVLVSMTLFMMVAATATPALLTAVRFSEANDNRVVAAGLAAAQIDMARANPRPATLTPGGTTVRQNGTTFTITRTIKGCPTPPTGALLTITVAVRWPGGAVHSDTLRAC